MSLFNSEDGDDRHVEARPVNPKSVKSDLSSYTQTLSHRLRGVAAFLAPPPPSISDQQFDSPTESSSSPAIRGIKRDLVEIEETIKSRLSLLSSFTSSMFNFNSRRQYSSEEEEEEEDNCGDYDDDREEAEEDCVAGTNEEVVEFVRELSSRPEFWTDFPTRLPGDFDMSDSQREHSAAIEHLVPSLESLRQNICNYMSDGHFWMIYFIILLPRFNESDLKYLSTPEIVAVREKLMWKLQNDRNNVACSSDNTEVDVSIEESVQDGKEGEELLYEQIIPADTRGPPQEANTDFEKPEQRLRGGGNPSLRAQRFSNEEQSDLEDDDKGLADGQARYRLEQFYAASSLSELVEWIQLDERSSDRQKASQLMPFGKDSEGEDSNGWDHVDDADIESLMSA